jgi:hypothetical protein
MIKRMIKSCPTESDAKASKRESAAGGQPADPIRLVARCRPWPWLRDLRHGPLSGAGEQAAEVAGVRRVV